MSSILDQSEPAISPQDLMLATPGKLFSSPGWLYELARRAGASADRAAVENPAAIFAFDLLVLDRADFRPRPLLQRKAALHGLLPGNRRIRYAGQRPS